MTVTLASMEHEDTDIVEGPFKLLLDGVTKCPLRLEYPTPNKLEQVFVHLVHLPRRSVTGGKESSDSQRFVLRVKGY